MRLLLLLLLLLVRLLLVRLLLLLLLMLLLLLLMVLVRLLLLLLMLLLLLLVLVRLPLLLLMLLLLLLVSTPGIAPPGSSASAPVTSPAMTSTPIAPISVGSNEGVPRPVPLLLLPRHLHLPIRAEHHIFKGLVRQLCIGEQNALLDSKSRGKIACKMLVSVDIGENHSMVTQSGPKHTTPRKKLVGAFPVLHPEAVPCLRKSGLLCCSLRCVMLLKSRPPLTRATCCRDQFCKRPV